MEPKLIKVFLRETRRRDISKYDPTSVHEAAHVKHHYLEPGFSEIWLKKFLIDRKNGWNNPEISEKNGLVDRRAAIDYTKDNFEFNIPTNEPDYSTTVDGVVIEVFGKGLSYKHATENLMIERDLIPRQLREYVRHLAFYPKLNVPGVTVFYGEVSKAWKKVCEDIAYSTSCLYAASMLPEAHRKIVTRIHTNEKTRERLEFLLESGFLEYRQSERLLDPAFRAKLLRQESDHASAKQPVQRRLVKTQYMFDGGYLI